MGPKLVNKNFYRHTEIGEDYYNLCRLCLTKTSLKLHIYVEEGQTREIQGKILNCLSLVVRENDNLPKFVCYSCIDKLDNFQDFRNMCHESENLLIEYAEKGHGRNSSFEKSSASWSHGSQETVALPVSAMGFQSPYMNSEEGRADPIAYGHVSLENMWPPDQPNVRTETTSSFVTPDIDMPSSAVDSKVSSHYMPKTSLDIQHRKIVDRLMEIKKIMAQKVPGEQNISGSEGCHPSDRGQFGVKVLAEDSDDDVVIISDDEDLKNTGTNPDHAEDKAADSGERHQKQNYSEEIMEIEGKEGEDTLLFTKPLPSPSEKLKSTHSQASRKDSKERCVAEDGILKEEAPSKPCKSVKGISCPKCDKIFKYKSMLAQHSTVHEKEKPFICTVCNTGYTRMSNLKVHMKIHMKEEISSCETCNKEFSCKEKLPCHSTMPAVDKSYICPVCSKAFSHRSILDLHGRVHVKKPHVCIVCKLRFSEEKRLAAHILFHKCKTPILQYLP